MLLLIGFAFLAGLVTIFAPCIWPLLPIVLSSAVAGSGKRRPLGITLGIVVSFTIATLALSTLVRIFHFNPNDVRLVAVIILGVLGIVMVFPFLSRYLELGVSRLSSHWGRRGQGTGSGFGTGFVTGLSLGIVWAPCAGPILAAVAALGITGQVSFSAVFVTLAYALGTGLPLFIIATGGQKLVTSVRALSPYTARIQQVFGVILIISAIGIYANYDQVIEANLLDRFPALSQSLSGFEGNQSVTNALNQLKQTSGAMALMPTPAGIPRDMSNLFNVNTPAPEITGITNWLNTSSSPITLKSLRGKVVLVDFWTYTCINCIRTLPHVTSWYDKYKDQGFVVLGIHTPEFEFEKETSNVQDAIKQFNIHYPVGQDNNYATWNAFNNEYWPAEYLIDAQGNIRREEFGEGNYDETEEAIQTLLAQTGQTVTTTLENMPDQTPTGSLSPESYVGADRAQFYYPSGSVVTGQQTFTLTANPPVDSFSFGGSWNIDSTDATTGSGATLAYNFQADKVFLVLRPGTNAQGTVKVFLDGQPISATAAGADVVNGVVTVNEDRLYNLVDLHGHNGEHVLKLEFDTPGVQAYAFTFG